MIKIKMGLKYHGVVEVKIPRKEIDKYNDILQKLIKTIDKNLILTIAGSYRRCKNQMILKSENSLKLEQRNC